MFLKRKFALKFHAGRDDIHIYDWLDQNKLFLLKAPISFLPCVLLLTNNKYIVNETVQFLHSLNSNKKKSKLKNPVEKKLLSANYCRRRIRG